MALTLQEVRARLDVDEPDYATLAVLGPEILPHLRDLVAGDDAGLAAKAVYLASLIDDASAIEVVQAGADSPEEVVRVAAAAALSNIAPEQAAPIVEKLLDDPDAGVRKLAVRGIARLGLRGLEDKLARMASDDDEEALRSIATEELRILRTEGVGGISGP